MSSINTNISALTAQKSMSDQVAKSEQAIERLSSGLRINNASDDASGSAIASKMEAQVRSLGVAIRNGHDAISMTQTAEGALGEMENILQRVRELAVQAGNSTLSASDRTAIQEEVTALTSEMNSIASSTNFNGVKLLDGTNASVNFQLGPNATDQLNVALESSKASDLGLGASKGANVYTSSRIESTGNDASAIAVDAIKINGQNAVVTQSATLNGTSNAAKLLADAINTNTLGHGAVATAYNRVVGAEMGANFNMTASFTVNGITIGVQSSMQAVVDKINQNVQDVNAELGANNSLILFNDSGVAIDVAGTSTGVGLATDDYEGFYKLENVDGSDVKVELGNLANGYVQAATATAANLAMYGLNETDGAGQLKSMAVSTDILATTDQIKINGVSVGATKVDSAQAKAAAINLVSEESGVVATATTTMFVDLDFDQDATASSFEVNGTAVDVNALNSVSDVAAAINTADVGVVATATSAGLLQLFDAGGGNITIDLTAPTAYVAAVTDADNNSVSIATANYTVRGNIELVAKDGGHIQLEDGTLTNTGLAKLGLEASSEMEVAGSGGVNVSTLAGATSSLANIDAAIDKLSGFRASFGAVENRIDAKINNLTTLKVNTQAAQSRIEDADFAAETTNMTKAQILSQAATSMLAQANTSKQNLLALLQG